MRIIKNLWTMAACCVFFLTACQQDEFRSATSGHVPVRFAPERATAGLTRVTGDDWDNGDEIGIIMIPATSTTSTDGETKTEENEQEDNVFTKYALDAYNIPYVFAVDGTNITLQAAAEKKPIYYPVSGEKVDFVAYYPYDENVTVNNSVYGVNVQNQSDPGAIDLLYAKTNDGYNKENADPVALKFEHQLSRLKLTVKAATDVDMDLTKVTLTGFPTTADFDLTTGKLDNAAVGDQDIEIVVEMNAETEKEITLILVPHNNDKQTYERKINFTIDGMVYTYEFEDDFALTAGSSRACTLTFTGTKVQIDDKTITLDSFKGDTQNIEFKSSADAIEAVLSTSPENIDGTIDWLTDTTLEKTDAIDPQTKWHTYKITTKTSKANITIDSDELPRTAYIHLREGNVTKDVITVQQLSEQLMVETPNPASFDGEDVAIEDPYSIFTMESCITTNWPDAPEFVYPDDELIIYNLTSTSSDDPRYTKWYISTIAKVNYGLYQISSELAITFGNITKTIKITPPAPVLKNTAPDGLSNCYVLGSGGTQSFSVKRAYSDPTTNMLRVNEIYSGQFKGDIIWEDNDDIVESVVVTGNGPEAIMTVKAGSGTGNALVALKKPNDEIVWSYHIWRSKPLVVSGILDRNLGATSNEGGKVATMGLTYQWGRKDPFPGSDDINAGKFPAWWKDAMTDEVDPIYAIKHPTERISNTNYKGMLSKYDDTWWGASHKQINDPCPMGTIVALNEVAPSEWAFTFDANKLYRENKEHNIGFQICWSVSNTDWRAGALSWLAEPQVNTINAYLVGYNLEYRWINKTALWRIRNAPVRCVAE